MPGFCPQFLAKPQKRLEFPERQECLCYANEATQGGPLESFRMGTGHQKDHMVRRLELWASLTSREWGWGRD